MDKTLGQVAYEAFGDSRNWKSITGYPLQSFEDLDIVRKDEWEYIGKTVADYVKQQEEGVSSPETGDEQSPNVEADDSSSV